MRNKKTNQGFTLIELLIVIAIIGILAAVLIPNLLSARDRALDTEAQACARDILTKAEIYFIDEEDYPNWSNASAPEGDYKVSCAELVWSGKLDTTSGLFEVEVTSDSGKTVTADNEGKLSVD